MFIVQRLLKTGLDNILQKYLDIYCTGDTVPCTGIALALVKCIMYRYRLRPFPCTAPLTASCPCRGERACESLRGPGLYCRDFPRGATLSDWPGWRDQTNWDAQLPFLKPTQHSMDILLDSLSWFDDLLWGPKPNSQVVTSQLRRGLCGRGAGYIGGCWSSWGCGSSPTCQ